MKKPPRIILGLSLGTRHIGFAVLNNNQIQDRRMKVYTEHWSKLKLVMIRSMLEKIIHKYGVTHIAVKTVNPLHTSANLKAVIKSITALSKKSGIAIHIYSLEELERYYSRERRVNKNTLMAGVLEDYPELIFEYRKEQKRKHPYYVKVFEAVATARLCAEEMK